jgi:O-antigen/teichoic acid export membrane protein
MLGHRTALSGSLLVVARLISRSIDLVIMLVLARLLSPSDFGLVAIAMIVVLIVEATLELPLSQALVRLPVIKPSYYDTAFTLSLLRGGVLCAVICACAVPFAQFYKHAALVPLICCLSLAPAARGLSNPRMAQFAKDLNFKYEFFFELAGKSSALVFGIATALITHSYWAIAMCSIAAPMVTTLLSYGVMPFRPRLTLSDWRVFADFLGWISVSQIITAMNWQSDQLLLGRLMSPGQLGLFTNANNVASIPALAIFAPILRPLLSAFAMVRHEPARLQRVYQNASTAIVAVGLPLMTWQSMVAGPMVRLLLGVKWLGAIPLLHWLAISVLPGFFGLAIVPLSMAMDQTRQLAWRSFVQFSVKLPCVIAGALLFGFMGVIAARVVSETVSAIYCMMIARRLLGLSVARQLLGCGRSVLATLVMAIVLNLYAALPSFGVFPLMLVLTLALSGTLAATTYCATLLALWFVAGKPPGIETTALRMAAVYGQRLGARINPSKPLS